MPFYNSQMHLRIVLVLAAAVVPLSAQNAAVDWPMFNRDLAGSRYSPLTQIRAGNVTTLRPVWTYRLQPAGFRFATAGGASELTPIVVKGVLYLSTQSRVVALDAASGREIWHYDVESGAASPLGVSYWPGDRQNPPRILFTAGRNLIALNAATGKVDPGFGNEGTVDMVVPYHGVPTIYKNVVLVGATTGEREDGPAGNSRAYDARTGAKLWEFQSIPQPGDEHLGMVHDCR